jgi:xanthine dehydrogenase accessory factor
VIVSPERLSRFLDDHPLAVLATISAAKGSVPRDAGAWMLITEESIFNTVGGGQLEFIAVEEARKLLSDGRTAATIDVPLGPAIGQCCGGHVSLDLRRLDDAVADEVAARVAGESNRQNRVYLFGAGHVGRALAEALALLPLDVMVVETRAEALAGLPESVARELTPLPEAIVHAAPPGAAFVVLTHDHALDFLVTRAALERGDAAYVGMIGSKTKRATFESQYRREGGDPARLTALTCPIGAKLSDKRPEVIAALVAAELLAAFSPR